MLFIASPLRVQAGTPDALYSFQASGVLLSNRIELSYIISMNITTTSPLYIIDSFFTDFITGASAHWHEPNVMKVVAFDQLMDELFFGNDEYRLHVEEYPDGIIWDGMIIPDTLIYERFEVKMAEICQISWADLKRAEHAGYEAYIKWIAHHSPDVLRRHLEGMKEIGGDEYVIAMERVLTALID